MSFAVRHRRRARAELDACVSQLGPAFGESVAAWLQELADEAERGEQVRSQDAIAFLQSAERTSETAAPPAGWDRWLRLGIGDKVRAFLAWLQAWGTSWPPERRPLWEFRMAMDVVLVPARAADGSAESPAVVLILYEVDRLEKQIVVTKYVELPCMPR